MTTQQHWKSTRALVKRSDPTTNPNQQEIRRMDEDYKITHITRGEGMFAAVTAIVMVLTVLALATYFMEDSRSQDREIRTLRDSIAKLDKEVGTVANPNSLHERVRQLESNQGHLLRTNDKPVELK